MNKVQMGRRNVFFLICAAFILGGYCAELYGIFKINTAACEDAYITYRFSRNLAEGRGPLFNAGDPVEGYSNTVWMAAIALAHWGGIDMALFSRVAGGLCSILTLLLVWYVPWRYFGCAGIVSLLGPLLYMLFQPFHFYATSGLETSFYTLLVQLCILAVLWARERPLPFVAASLIFVVTALTRPDGIIFFGFYGLFVFGRLLVSRKPLRPYLPGVLVFCVIYGLFICWRLSYYGLPLPNTYYAKGSFPLVLRAALGALMNKGFVAHYAYLPLLFVSLIGFVKLKFERRLLVLVTFMAAGLFFSIGFSGFDWMPFFRYTLPVVPVMIMLCQVAVSRLWHRLAAGGDIRRMCVWAGALVFFLALAAEQFYVDMSLNVRWNAVSEFAMHNQRFFGTWIKRHGDPDAVWAMGDVGRLAYFSEARIVDIFGLTSREFADIKNRYGAPELQLPACRVSFDGYKEKERELLLKLAPDYVLLYNARLKISDTFPGSVVGIADHPAFQQQYEYLDTFYTIPQLESPAWPKLPHVIDVTDLSAGLLSWIKNGWGYDIYIRRDSPFVRFRFSMDAGGLIRQVVVAEEKP
ncbi:MAG: glycosyltransferase family 39 protein [Deltaproteobacteria bacterium]|nr:glycosyltransferase family 39 protein [Deltaproteobacteria bacterium]